MYKNIYEVIHPPVKLWQGISRISGTGTEPFPEREWESGINIFYQGVGNASLCAVETLGIVNIPGKFFQES